MASGVAGGIGALDERGVFAGWLPDVEPPCDGDVDRDSEGDEDGVTRDTPVPGGRFANRAGRLSLIVHASGARARPAQLHVSEDPLRSWPASHTPTSGARGMDALVTAESEPTAVIGVRLEHRLAWTPECPVHGECRRYVGGT
jgi:hypothetical protein